MEGTVEAALGWVLSCPAGRGVAIRTTQHSHSVMPAQTSSSLSHPPSFDCFPTNAPEVVCEHKEVDFFFPILFLNLAGLAAVAIQCPGLIF